MLQKTIQQPIKLSGVGLHSGKMVHMVLRPGLADSGVIFNRTDINTSFSNAPNKAIELPLCTTLINDAGFKLSTIEHLNSALHALGIDNIVVEIDGAEIPILDGSAIQFVEAILQAGIQELNTPKLFIKVKQEIEVKDDDKFARLAPYNSFFLKFTIDFKHPVIPPQFSTYELELNSTNFIDNIARARTFGFLKDVEYLRTKNLILGGSLENAIVLDDTSILNPGGLIYKDELVRHKILDAIGDLYLGNKSILGKFTAYKSSHTLNNRLLRKLFSNSSFYEIVQIN